MLDELGSKALHGEQVAIGTIVMQYLQGKDWTSVKGVMQRLSLPTRLSDIGINGRMAAEALAKARDVRDRYTILNRMNIDENKAREILERVDVL